MLIKKLFFVYCRLIYMKGPLLTEKGYFIGFFTPVCRQCAISHAVVQNYMDSLDIYVLIVVDSLNQTHSQVLLPAQALFCI